MENGYKIENQISNQPPRTSGQEVGSRIPLDVGGKYLVRVSALEGIFTCKSLVPKAVFEREDGIGFTTDIESAASGVVGSMRIQPYKGREKLRTH